jgi:hypothetical protein
VVLDQSTVIFQNMGWGVLLDKNGGNVMRYSSSQNSHFEKVKVDFIDQLVANFRSMFPS